MSPEEVKVARDLATQWTTEPDTTPAAKAAWLQSPLYRVGVLLQTLLDERAALDKERMALYDVEQGLREWIRCDRGPDGVMKPGIRTPWRTGGDREKYHYEAHRLECIADLERLDAVRAGPKEDADSGGRT
jgi:hypothetical protein